MESVLEAAVVISFLVLAAGGVILLVTGMAVAVKTLNELFRWEEGRDKWND